MNAVEMQGITKRFSGINAVDHVNFTVEQGEIHALVGENGAGKSTLMKVLAGTFSHTDYTGKILINGEEKRFSGPKEAMDEGVIMVHQELALIEELTVAENLFLGNYPGKNGIVDYKRMKYEAAEQLKKLGLSISPNALIKTIGVGQQQLVEIAKSIIHGGKILILDEPTAPLTETEIKYLFGLLKELKSKGISMIYISHRMEEIFEISDSITVMRDGKMIQKFETAKTNQHEIVSTMIGRELKEMYPSDQTAIGKTSLEIEHYSVANKNYPERYVVNDVCMQFREGEIVGISGLLGSGRTELMSAICGVYPQKGRGTVRLYGKEMHINSPRKAIRSGIGFLTEDRKRTGLILGEKISTNITLASFDRIATKGWLHKGKEKAIVKKYISDLSIKTNNSSNKVSSLSGGNQQKIVLAKWLAVEPKVFILDEPTRGVDVNAKSEIYTIMKKLAKQKYTVIVISSDLPEIIGMSDRVYVMHEGKLAGELMRSELTEKTIMNYAVGIQTEI